MLFSPRAKYIYPLVYSYIKLSMLVTFLSIDSVLIYPSEPNIFTKGFG